MKTDPAKAALMPKMTGGENPGKNNPAPVASPTFTPAQVKQAEARSQRTEKAKDPAPAPPRREPAPALPTYWSDDQGAIWRRDPAPEVILQVQYPCKPAELDRVMKALLNA